MAKHYGLCCLLSTPQLEFAAAKAICSYEELHGGDAPWQSGIVAPVLIDVTCRYLCSMDKSILKLVSLSAVDQNEDDQENHVKSTNSSEASEARSVSWSVSILIPHKNDRRQ